LNLHPNNPFMEECLPKLISIFEDTEKEHLRRCGLYWTNDGNDGGEFSISGPGIRLNMSSYLYGDAMAISRMAATLGKTDISDRFRNRAEEIKEKMDLLLWDGDFYRNIPCTEEDAADFESRPNVPDDNRARELTAYLPWYFNMPNPEKADMFRELTDEDGFKAPFGLTTAEQRHPRFMFQHEHECLWNGPVWPFATSQTLVAVANHLRTDGEAGITKKDFYEMLIQFAASHRLVDENGKEHLWIDEDMDPFTGEWIARNELMLDHWNPERGGVERGKDYNHSTFCDLVLSSLLGICMENGNLQIDPFIPKEWDYFCVSNLLEGQLSVVFDRTGTKYGLGKGLMILDQEGNVLSRKADVY